MPFTPSGLTLDSMVPKISATVTSGEALGGWYFLKKPVALVKSPRSPSTLSLPEVNAVMPSSLPNVMAIQSFAEQVVVTLGLWIPVLTWTLPSATQTVNSPPPVPVMMYP